MKYLTFVDLSAWNGSLGGKPPVDFSVLAQNVDGFIIKASGWDAGTGQLERDPDLTYNQTQARATGKPIAYYHYSGGLDPVVEGDFFLAQVGQLQEGECLANDFEINYPTPGPWCGQFYNHIHDQNGVWCWQYSPRALMAVIEQSVPEAGKWVADPSDSPDGTVMWPPGQAVPYEYIAQQFTSTGLKPGVQGFVDLNAVYLTLDQIREYGYRNSVSPQTPVEPVQPPEVQLPVEMDPIQDPGTVIQPTAPIVAPVIPPDPAQVNIGNAPINSVISAGEAVMFTTVDKAIAAGGVSTVAVWLAHYGMTLSPVMHDTLASLLLAVVSYAAAHMAVYLTPNKRK